MGPFISRRTALKGVGAGLALAMAGEGRAALAAEDIETHGL